MRLRAAEKIVQINVFKVRVILHLLKQFLEITSVALQPLENQPGFARQIIWSGCHQALNKLPVSFVVFVNGVGDLAL